ncbi:MAG: MFS family permease [Yoonia sp.]|jgi:MFS family permease
MAFGTRTRSGLVAFQNVGFRNYWITLICTGFAIQIQTVAVGWQVYDLTRNPFDLGLIGLSQFAPALLLVFVTGTVADRFPRRWIIGISLCVMATGATGLLLLTAKGIPHVGFVFLLMAVFGTARAFYNPARQSIVPNLVPPKHLAQAVATTSSGAQISTICGPVAGGLLYGLSPYAAYGTSVVLFLTSASLMLILPKLSQNLSKRAANWETLSAGFRYIWTQKVILGAISLDLFAVILGGATALLPVFARDVLDIGPAGLGFLRAGPGIGAIAVGLYLMANPITNHAGRAMFIAVAIFGAFTTVFALSETVWLSIAALIVLGGADMVSVFVRSTLIQLWTPDELRGRVNAVNQVFIGASNEVGAFRAGSLAAFMGPVTAVLVGGVGTLIVAGVWLKKFPELGRIRKLDGT